jgi:RimJ/RimL family protein N-acetyltransferase
MVEIVTKLLRWRPPEPGDGDALHALLSEWDVVRMSGTIPWPPEREETERRCQPIDPADGLAGHVFAGDVLVGTCAAHQTEKGPMLGYLIAPAFWGRGYASEIAGALMDEVWRRYDWEWVRATVFEDNPVSMRVIEKLGFVEIERGTGTSRARGGGPIPVRRYRKWRP